METATLEHRPRVLPRPHCVEEMASLPIPNELLAEIFLRLPTPADLARASATCPAFRRVAADRAFLRRYRKLHPPPLLGFLDSKVFHPADPPHHSAPAASAAALAADFSFSFLPGPAADWRVQDVCDGRVLLDRPSQRDIDEERRYIADPGSQKRLGRQEYFLVLDTRRMEFSIADPPAESREHRDMNIGIVESGEGGLGMFVRPHMASDLTYYTLRQEIGGSSSKWHKEKTVSLGSRYIFIGSTGSYFLLQRWGTSALERGCFTLDVKTFKLKRVCAPKSLIPNPRAYFNFPPSLLSIPRISSGTQEGTDKAMREQGEEALQAEEPTDSTS